jgi:hypothetical protein
VTIYSLNELHSILATHGGHGQSVPVPYEQSASSTYSLQSVAAGVLWRIWYPFSMVLYEHGLQCLPQDHDIANAPNTLGCCMLCHHAGQQQAAAAAAAVPTVAASQQQTKQVFAADPGEVEKYPQPPAQCHTMEFSE